MNFFALGGLDEIGCNTYIFEIKKKIYIINFGCSLASWNYPGVDYIIADLSYLKKYHNNIEAIIFTNCNLYNIGAFIYFIKEFNDVPIYASNVTKFLLNQEILNANRIKLKKLPLNFVDFKNNETIKLNDDCSLTPYELPSFLPGNYGILLESTEGNVFFATDYLYTQKLLWNKSLNSPFMQLKNKKINLFLTDVSPNSLNNNNSLSNINNFAVYEYLKSTILGKEQKYFICANYFHNLSHINEIIKFCIDYNLVLCVLNKNIYSIIKFLAKENYIDTKNLFLINNLNDAPGSKKIIVFIMEHVNKLYEKLLYYFDPINNFTFAVSKNNNLFISLIQPIPGHELNYASSMDKLTYLNIPINAFSSKNLQTSQIGSDQLLNFIDLINPDLIIPVSGMFKVFKELKKIVLQSFPNKKIMLLNNNEIINLNFPQKMYKVLPHKLEVNSLYLQGIGLYDINSIILNERKNLGNNGIIIVFFVINQKTKEIITPIVIKAIGCTLLLNDHDTKNDLIEEIKKIYCQSIPTVKNTNKIDFANNEIKLYLKKYFSTNFDKYPLISVTIL